jgi:hypothetical protein
VEEVTQDIPAAAGSNDTPAPVQKLSVNSVGTVTSERGYVICRECGREVTEISKETAYEFAYCPGHRPNEEVRSELPRNSAQQTQEGARAMTTATMEKKKTKKPRAEHMPKKPKEGGMASLIAWAKEEGGVTQEQIDSKYKSFGLGGKSNMHAAYQCRKLKLLKEEDKPKAERKKKKTAAEKKD